MPENTSPERRTAVAQTIQDSGGHGNDKARENLLDQSLAATFPASDPVSVTQPGGGPDTSADRPDALDRLLGDRQEP